LKVTFKFMIDCALEEREIRRSPERGKRDNDIQYRLKA